MYVQRQCIILWIPVMEAHIFKYGFSNSIRATSESKKSLKSEQGFVRLDATHSRLLRYAPHNQPLLCCVSLKPVINFLFHWLSLKQIAFKSSWLHRKTHKDDISHQVLHVIQHEVGQAAAVSLSPHDAPRTSSWIMKQICKVQQTYHPPDLITYLQACDLA